ncbi:MAG: hypothetical protein CBC42_00145 [Betaproteobacteria bacterium TMED82]|nr:MAG: hypothetical protein CBC42_00145 [Betaproteobacteria bacterium TMED82]
MLLVAVCSDSIGSEAVSLGFVTNQGDDSVYVFDTKSKPSFLKKINVGASPAGICVSETLGKVFVSNTKGNSISVIDISRLEVTNTLKFEGSSVGLGFSEATNELFVSDWFNDRVLVFNIESSAISHEINVGKAPAGVAVSKKGLVFVINRDSDSISVVSIEKKSVIAEIIVGSHPFGARLNPSETSLYVTNVQSNDVSIVDVADFSSTLRVKVGKKPYSIAFSKDGLKAYVTNQYSDSVSVIDTTSNEVTNTLSVGGFPEGIEVHNNNIYVVNWMDEEMQIVNENNVAVERLLPLGSNPRNFVNFSSPRFKLQ